MGYGYHGGGRPKIGNGKSKNLNIRLSEESLNLIKEKAKTEGLSVSDYVVKKCTE